MMKQRAFLKAVLIKEAMKGPFYGLDVVATLAKIFIESDYKPVHSEVYKSLFSLVDAGALKGKKIYIKEVDYAEGQLQDRAYIVEYRIDDAAVAEKLLSEYSYDMKRTVSMIDNFKKTYK